MEIVSGGGGQVRAANAEEGMAAVPTGSADNETQGIERGAEVISPGTASAFWEVLLLSQHQPGKCGTTTGSQALRNGNWETNHGGKGNTGKLLFYFFSKKKVSSSIR